MIEYYEQLTQDEQEEVSSSIKLLYKQTFILEWKYDKGTGRMKFNRDFRYCNKHLSFIREYFEIMGIEVRENSQDGMIYLQGESLMGDKVSKLTTLYILALKLIYDEQMSTVSSSSQVITTLSELHEKLSSFKLLFRQPAPTQVRSALSFLKKYQMIEPLDALEDTEGRSRILVYPSIHMVLLGDDIRALLDTFKESEEEDDGTEPAI